MTISEVVSELLATSVRDSALAQLNEETEESKQRKDQEYDEARKRFIALIKSGIDFGTNGRDWKREELYEERLKRFDVS